MANALPPSSPPQRWMAAPRGHSALCFCIGFMGNLSCQSEIFLGLTQVSSVGCGYKSRDAIMGQHADEKILRDSGVQLCRFYEAADESPLDVVGCWFNSRAAFRPNFVTNDLVIGVPLSKP